jgi:hypothetical protein
MKRAVAAPILSILLPGLGQLVNRQAGKGAALVGGSGLVALVGVGLAMYKLNQAMVKVMELPPHEQNLEALSKAMWQQGAGSLLALACVFVVMMIFSIWDAHKVGKRLDQADQAIES